MTETRIMTSLPTPVELTKAEAAALRKLNDKKAGIDSFINTIMQQGEARVAELQVEGRMIWQSIAAAHKLDLESINYTLSDDGENLVPVGMKL